MQPSTAQGAPHRFSIGPCSPDSATAQTDSFLSSLQQVVNAGDRAVTDFIGDELAALNELLALVATGGERVWIEGTDQTSQMPVYYVANGNNYLSFEMCLNSTGMQTLSQGSADPAALQSVGYVFVWLSLGVGTPNERISQVSSNILEYAGGGIPDLTAGDGLRTLIKKVTGKVKSFLSKFIENVVGKPPVDTVPESDSIIREGAQDAAKQAETSGEKIIIGDSVTVEISVEFALVGVANLALQLGQLIVGFTTLLLSKSQTNYVRLYNLTRQELRYAIGWLKEEAVAAVSPSLPTDPIYLPAPQPTWTPQWLIGNKPVHWSQFMFVNTDQLKGIGYVLTAPAQGAFPGLTVMVNIPNAGANSLALQLQFSSDCAQYWQTTKNKEEVLTLTTTSGPYTLSIATNQLSGKSPSPVDGTLGYNYEHLIVLTETVTTT